MPPTSPTDVTTSTIDFFEKIATTVTNASSISSAQLNGLKNIFQAAASTSSRITSPITTLPSPVTSISCSKNSISSSKSSSPTSNFSTTTVVELLNEMNYRQRSNSPKELKRKIANSPSNSQVIIF